MKREVKIKQVRLDAELADLMAKLASLEGDGNAADYLSSFLRPIIERELIKASARLTKSLSKTGEPAHSA